MQTTKIDQISPEEKLELLYHLLRANRLIDALILFKMNSTSNQFTTFRNVLSKEKKYSLLRSKSYLIINGKFPTIIGLDDNFQFFCHNLPTPTNIEYPVTDYEIKRLMGFDIHYWEYTYRAINIFPVTIRLQGDILLRIKRVFEDTEHLIHWLQERIIQYLLKLLKIPTILAQDNPLEQHNPNRFFFILQQVLEILPKHKRKIVRLKLEFLLNKYYPNLLVESQEDDILFVLNALRNITLYLIRGLSQLERRLLVSIGNHKLKFIGVPTDSIRSFAMNILGIERDRLQSSFLLLREQSIYAMHDEHNNVSLNIKPTIIQLDTIPTGPYQVTRNQIFNGIHNYKATLIFLCRKNLSQQPKRKTMLILERPKITVELYSVDATAIYHKLILLTDINIYYLCNPKEIKPLKTLIGLSLLAKNKIFLIINEKYKDTLTPQILRILGKYKQRIKVFILEIQKPHYLWYGIKRVIIKGLNVE